MTVSLGLVRDRLKSAQSAQGSVAKRVAQTVLKLAGGELKC
jgi:hypothetical protein